MLHNFLLSAREYHHAHASIDSMTSSTVKMKKYFLGLLFIIHFSVCHAEPPPAILLESAPGLSLRGSGVFRYFGLRIYDAVLWSSAPLSTERVDFSQPLALQLRYALRLEGRAIADRSIQEIAQLGIGTPEQRSAWQEALRRVLPDVDSGTVVAGVHVPGRGAKFFLNGAPLGEVNDPAFSQAFFSIWLDPKTSAPDLRTALIGSR